MGKKVEQIARNPKTNANAIKENNECFNKILPYFNRVTGKDIYYDSYEDNDVLTFLTKALYDVTDKKSYIDTTFLIYGYNDDNGRAVIEKDWIASNNLTSETFTFLADDPYTLISYNLEIGSEKYKVDIYFSLDDNDFNITFYNSSDGTSRILYIPQPHDESDYLALSEDVPSYRHTITLTSSTNADIMFTFTTPKKDNTDINSLTDLISKFGNTSIQGMGSDGTNTLAYLHIGTSTTDTYFKTTTNQQVTLANSGFTNVADEVTTIS